MLKVLFLVILMIGFVSAVDIEWNCPNKIYVNEEFECSLDVSGGDGIYDFKIDLDGERKSALEIWSKDFWKSGYYYLIDFIDNGDVKNVRLKISKEGNYNVILKLRQGGERSEFDVDEIRVLKTEKIENNVEAEPKLTQISTDLFKKNKSHLSLNNEIKTISLSGDATKNKEWDYVSKDGMIVDWLPYGFCLFLIFLVGILIWH